MKKLLAASLFVLGLACAAHAGGPAPEMDPSMVGSSLLLIGGVVLVIRASRKK